MLGQIARAGRATANWTSGTGLIGRGLRRAGNFVAKNPQASMYGGMMGIGAGIGAFSDSDSVVGNALQWGAMGAGLRYGSAGLRGARAAGQFMRRGGVTRNTNNLYERARDWASGAGMSIGYAGRADWNRLRALGRASRTQWGNLTASSGALGKINSRLKRF